MRVDYVLVLVVGYSSFILFSRFEEFVISQSTKGMALMGCFI